MSSIDIRQSPEYQQGYHEGYREGLTKASQILQKEFEMIHISKPITFKCEPKNGVCPIIEAITENADLRAEAAKYKELFEKAHDRALRAEAELEKINIPNP